jgi:hypothetical protein
MGGEQSPRLRGNEASVLLYITAWSETQAGLDATTTRVDRNATSVTIM